MARRWRMEKAYFGMETAYFLKGVLSLIRPRSREEIYDVSDMQRETWEAVGDSLRFAMNAYGEKQKYKTGIKAVNHAKSTSSSSAAV